MTEPKKKPVHEAWSDVMGAVRAIEKSERNASQGFNFRGVDTVTNVVGPRLREHGVTVLPVAEEITQSDYITKGGKGTAMVRTVVKMKYTIIGPDGSTMTGGAFGEAADAGDKSASKAESVAYRVFLLQSLAIPTDDPDSDLESEALEPATDPDARAHELGWKDQAERDAWIKSLGARLNNLDDESAQDVKDVLTEAGIKSSTMTKAQGLKFEALLKQYQPQEG